MSNRRAQAWALIAASSFFVAILAVHPAHQGAPLLLGFSLNEMVHAAAILAAPLYAYGGLALHDRVGRDRPAATLALVFWLFGAYGILLAATISGLVTPRAIEFAGAGHGDGAGQALQLSVWLNRGLAQAHSAMTALAILPWAAAWPSGKGALALRLWGIAVGLGILGWQLSGTLALDVHQMFVVTLAFASWVVPAALTVLREDRAGAAGAAV